MSGTHEFLRDPAGNPAVLSLQIAAKKKELNLLNHSERLICLGELGTLYRSLRDYKAAQSYFEQALQLADELNDLLRLAANQVRLGVAQHHGGQWDAAQISFNSVLQDSRPEFQSYHDFAWQHLGKLKVEQGELMSAQHCFEQALVLRLEKQDVTLIQSTQDALAGLQALSNQKSP